MAFCVVPITQVFYAYEKQALGLVWQLWSVPSDMQLFISRIAERRRGSLLADGVVGVLAYAVVVVMALQWSVVN